MRVEPYRVGGVALRTVELDASQGRGGLASSLVGGKPSDDVLGPAFGKRTSSRKGLSPVSVV